MQATPTRGLQELLTEAEACGIRPTDEELAALRYRDLQWQRKHLAEGHALRAAPTTARAARCALVVTVAHAEAATLPTDDSSASVPIITDCVIRLTEPQPGRRPSADTVSLQPGSRIFATLSRRGARNTLARRHRYANSAR